MILTSENHWLLLNGADELIINSSVAILTPCVSVVHVVAVFIHVRFKDDRPLKKSEFIKIITDVDEELVSLEFSETSRDDSGTYKLVVTNPLGRAETSSLVDVHCMLIYLLYIVPITIDNRANNC